ncbi:MAG: L-aspartate oxidase [Acidobacteria bacterium]|nr:MAG: L-aspartate oxidase [Acidobacteriota bacterium]
MNFSYDFIVIGAGVAGLRAAIGLNQHGSVLCLAKRELSESNTQYAQGGIAVALSPDDSPEIHLRDTLAAGAGLVDEDVARILVTEGPQRVLELLDWGARFDRDDAGKLAFTREGAHSRNRVLHADGDSTGREIGRTLTQYARDLGGIHFSDFGFARDLLLQDGRVVGVEILYDDGRIETVTARAVLLATGGAGMVFANTTNPEVATADGPAMALRAGAELSDMEFLQFHPTALYVENAPRFLLSEALRGEGAYLRNSARERFMPNYHELAELASRDVVARAIHRELEISTAAEPMVYLDVTHLKAENLKVRFPRIYKTLQQHGLDITRDLIPIRPAAHYIMGGVRTDLNARTSLPGLYAAGEAACTGVHGGNRLASNSLLEGLVFGARAARAMVEEIGPEKIDSASTRSSALVYGDGDDEALRSETQQLMWSNVGIVRDAERLCEAVERLKKISALLPAPTSRQRAEARNIAESGLAIARSALARLESRGSHYRSDFPNRDDANFRKHSILRCESVRFE